MTMTLLLAVAVAAVTAGMVIVVRVADMARVVSVAIVYLKSNSEPCKD
jgi:hypothetical protein